MEQSREKPFLRTVRSFVKREGRLTEGQKKILEHSPYLIPQAHINQIWDLNQLFGRINTKRTLEIGFGDGTSLVEMAMNNPDRDYLGIEVHRPGVGHILLAIERLGLSNLYVIDYDAVHLIENCFPSESFDCVQIFFPDPWHKKKHHKRRLIQEKFLDQIVRILRKNGLLHLATDWEHYAQHMLTVLNEHLSYKNRYNDYSPRPPHRPFTKFERRGERLGHGVWDLLFEKI